MKIQDSSAVAVFSRKFRCVGGKMDYFFLNFLNFLMIPTSTIVSNAVSKPS